LPLKLNGLGWIVIAPRFKGTALRIYPKALRFNLNALGIQGTALRFELIAL